MFICPPPLCSCAVDGDDDDNSDSDDEDVGDNIAAGGGKGWDDDVRRGDVVHQVSWRAHPGLDCGHDECECDEFRRIVRVGNDDER